VSGTALVTGVLTTTAATVFNGGFASNADSTLGTDKKVQFRDSAIYINSSARFSSVRLLRLRLESTALAIQA
jgi:hypothetical protein